MAHHSKTQNNIEEYPIWPKVHLNDSWSSVCQPCPWCWSSGRFPLTGYFSGPFRLLSFSRYRKHRRYCRFWGCTLRDKERERDAVRRAYNLWLYVQSWILGYKKMKKLSRYLVRHYKQGGLLPESKSSPMRLFCRDQFKKYTAMLWCVKI